MRILKLLPVCFIGMIIVGLCFHDPKNIGNTSNAIQLEYKGINLVAPIKDIEEKTFIGSIKIDIFMLILKLYGILYWKNV